jgi:hypothetical protein
MNSRLVIAAASLVLLAPLQADVFDDWLKARAGAPQAAVDQTTATAGKKLPTQTQSISVDHGSTSFVDQSAASDLVSTALNLTPLASGSNSQSGSGTVTASVYSIYALAVREDPLVPNTYNRRSSFVMRKASITLGREQTDSSGGSTTTPAGTIFGARWMVLNDRDATSIAKNEKVQQEIGDLLSKYGNAESAARKKVTDVLLERPLPEGFKTKVEYLNSLTVDKINAEIAKLSPVDQARVDQIVNDYKAALHNAGDLDALVKALQRKPQISLDFQTIQRVESLSDDYRVQFIYDQGFKESWAATFNGSYDYSNSHKIGGDVRGARGALEFRYNITKVSGFSLRSPLSLAVSGEGVHKEGEWDYRAQLQLMVPIASGVNLPFSFGYGNQKSVLMMQEKGVYGKFGLTLDLAKVVDALKNAH